MIDPQRWPRVKELFEQALDRPEAERDAFLDELEGDDRELRDEVASLLAAHREDGFLAEPAAAQLAIGGAVDGGSSDPLVGRAVGSWRLVRKIGQGGMGTVYEGRRADDPEGDRNDDQEPVRQEGEDSVPEEEGGAAEAGPEALIRSPSE